MPYTPVVVSWSDDSSTWQAIIPILNEAGLRTISPTTRGFGKTRFLSPDTRRTGHAAILALDVIQMLDVLGIAAFSVAGHDWGSNMAGMLAAGWPDRGWAHRHVVVPADAG
jgi:pimeloyl-ACP methyl ester carboxylesterase